jgi:hypothetical protein
MDVTRIVELFIDEEYEEAGIEAISLVSRPAHDENWQAFKTDCGCKKDNFEDVEPLNPYQIVNEDFCSTNPKLRELGEDYSELINDGWEVVRVEKMTPTVVHQMNQHRFSNPNADSILDKENFRIRYKYVGPRDNKNRQFCAEMLAMNKVYRIEDIDELTDSAANEQFGFYNIFLWRGSFNCRHQWVRLIYARQGSIRNTGTSTKGLVEEQGLGPNLQPNTVPLDQRDKVSPREGSSYERTFGLEDACWEGYEAIGTKIVDGKEVPNCVPVKMTEDDFAESISDYPEGVKEAAARAVKYAEEKGWGSCGTSVGKQRASQLAKGENISVDTLKRMYSYLSRHKVDLTSSKEYGDGCGKLMYDAWGGEAGLKWAERKLEQIQKQKMTFAFDEDKKIIIGAAMVPNRMIHRYDEQGNLYYVFFSKKSIKMMADKFLKEKRTDETSIEHNGIKLGKDKVYITESWISEDPIHDKSFKFGFELPEGTWFVAMKVYDDKIWKMIKQKALNGFSVEGLFAEKSVFSKEDKQINQIKQILKSVNDE